MSCVVVETEHGWFTLAARVSAGKIGCCQIAVKAGSLLVDVAVALASTADTACSDGASLGFFRCSAESSVPAVSKGRLAVPVRLRPRSTLRFRINATGFGAVPKSLCALGRPV